MEDRRIDLPPPPPPLPHPPQSAELPPRPGAPPSAADLGDGWTRQSSRGGAQSTGTFTYGRLAASRPHTPRPAVCGSLPWSQWERC